MASRKVEKPVGTKLPAVLVKKEPAKASTAKASATASSTTPKAPASASKPVPKKAEPAPKPKPEEKKVGVPVPGVVNTMIKK